MVICVVVLLKHTSLRDIAAAVRRQSDRVSVGSDRNTLQKGAEKKACSKALQGEQNPTPNPAQEIFVNNALQSRFARLRNLTTTRPQIKHQAALAARTAAPLVLAFTVSTIAHAQTGSIDMSGATNVMNTFKTFAEYAGAVICLGSLIFAGIKMMGGNFQQAIPGLFGALFGAGVLGWGANWISSLTGQSVTQ
jgi:hypothetical protein